MTFDVHLLFDILNRFEITLVMQWSRLRFLFNTPTSLIQHQKQNNIPNKFLSVETPTIHKYGPIAISHSYLL